MSSSLFSVYIITGIVSVIIAFILVYFSALSDNSKRALDKKKKEARYLEDEPAEEGPLHQVIYNRLTNVVNSREDCKEVARFISDMFNKEIEKKAGLQTEEFSKRYESVLKEKTESEEVAWGKYKKELADKKQTEAVIRSIAEGLVVVDSTGRVIMLNPAAEKLLGVSKRDKIGRPVLENLKEEQLVSLVKSVSGSGEKEIELASQHDETKKILKASSAVIENENGQTVGMVSVLSDITKQKELDELKSNFVASVSHELRTPLIAIEKSVSLMLSKATGPISENQEQFLNIAERNLKRLTSLINDLLDLSKFEAGRMELKRQPCSIESIIDESIKSFDTWAGTKSIVLKKDFKGGLVEAHVDPDRIMQVLNNLIGNAIKFTPPNGGITIEAGADKDSGEIRISVKDTGAGIAKEDISKIFDKFYQAGKMNHGDIMGTGIGLSIAKEIVELHGGRIWAESEKGQGAKFIFTLPLTVYSSSNLKDG